MIFEKPFRITVYGSNESLLEFQKIMKDCHPNNLTFDNVEVTDIWRIEEVPCKDGLYCQSFSGNLSCSMVDSFFKDNYSPLSEIILENPLETFGTLVEKNSINLLMQNIVKLEKTGYWKDELSLLGEDFVIDTNSLNSIKSREKEMADELFERRNQEWSPFVVDYLSEELKGNDSSSEDTENSEVIYADIVEVSKKLNLEIVLASTYNCEDEGSFIQKIKIGNGYILENIIEDMFYEYSFSDIEKFETFKDKVSEIIKNEKETYDF